MASSQGHPSRHEAVTENLADHDMRPGQPMKAFVPLTDDELYALGGTESLVPYRPGLPLASQFSIAPPAVEEPFSPAATEAGHRDAPPAPLLCPR